MPLHAAGSAPSKHGYTLEYACLETLQHLLGRGSGDGADLAAADAYATGVTLFRLATGELPLRMRSERRFGKAAMARWESRLLKRVGARAHDSDSDAAFVHCDAPVIAPTI